MKDSCSASPHNKTGGVGHVSMDTRIYEVSGHQVLRFLSLVFRPAGGSPGGDWKPGGAPSVSGCFQDHEDDIIFP